MSTSLLDVRSPVVGPGSTQPVLEAVAARWTRLAVSGGPPVRTVVVGIDRSPDAKVVLLLFDAAGALVAVAKVARSMAGEDGLRSEHRALRAVGCASSSALSASVPKALMLTRIGECLTLVQTSAAGRPMSADYFTAGHVDNPAAVASDFSAAGTWLAVLQSGTSSGRMDTGEAARRWLFPTMDAYLDLTGDDSVLELFDEVRGRIAEAAGTSVPVTAVHGDFWMGNILRERAGHVSAVVDWERSRVAGVPLVDALKFPTSYGLYLDRAQPWRRGKLPAHPHRGEVAARWAEHGSAPNLVGFAYTYFGRGWFPQLVRSFVSDHLRRLHISRQLLGPYFVGFLAEQVLAANTPAFRDDYRRILGAFAAERERCWVWRP